MTFPNEFFEQPDKQAENPQVPKGMEEFWEIDTSPREPASLADQPNFDRLTPTERWVYDKLPGFSQSKFGQALGKFGESWAGKALGYLDIFAEGLERLLGFARQFPYMDYDDELSLEQLHAAWYAGGLLYDMTNYPQLRRDEEGNITGVSIPSDLPGIEGLTQARHQIAALMRAGVDPGEALIKVRDQYYNDLGALSIRSQLQDTFFHIFADPANFVLPYLKPAERLQAVRTLALAGKIPVDDLAKMEKAARAAGNVAEAERIAQTITKVDVGELRKLTTFDKFAIFATGGNPLEPNKLAKGFVGKINPLALKPEARAQELVTMLTDNVGSYILSKHWDDPEAAVKAIVRAEKGALGPEFGHAFLSIEGRSAQGFMGGVSAKAQDLLGHYKAVVKERDTLARLSGLLGEDAGKLVIRMGDEPEVVLRQIMKKINTSPELMAMAQAGELTVEELGRIGKTLKSLPYDSNSFMAELMIRVEDFGMQQAILQFGVEARGLITRWAHAVKSAETLAFLRLNPAYMIRNVVNNELTMLSRGVWNAMPGQQIADFWATQGWRPRRLAQGFGMAGEAIQIESKAAKMLEKALRGSSKSAAYRARDFFSGIDIGKFDMGKLSGIAEQGASTRAFTSGYIQGIREYFWRGGKGFDRLGDVLKPSEIDALRKIDPDLPELIEYAVQSSGAIEHKLDEALKANARINLPALTADLEEKLGYKIDDVLGPELTERLTTGLPQAVQEGRVEQFFTEMRRGLDDHLDDLFEQSIEELPGIVEQQVKAGGPQMFYRKFGSVIDEYWAGELEHSMRMPAVTEAARSAQAEGNFERASALWAKIRHDEDLLFKRRDQHLQSTLKGLEKGAKEAGIGMPSEVSSNFRQITREWRKFFNARNKGYKELQGLQGEEFTNALGKLRNELDTRYTEMVELEQRLIYEVDEAVAQMIDEPQLQAAFRNWRNMVAEQRRVDKETTAELMKYVRDIPPDMRQQAFEEFWAERHERYLQMYATERAGLQMMEGDPQAMQHFAVPPTTVDTTGLEGEALIRKIGSAYGIGTEKSDKHLVNAINKYMPGETKFTSLEEVAKLPNAEEIVREAMETRKAQKAGALQTFVGDVDKIAPDPFPLDLGMNNLAYGRTHTILDTLETAVTGMKKTPVYLDQLPVDARKALEKYIARAKGQMGDARFAATRFAEYRRDAALLNYNRRTNFDGWVSNMFPYAFWTTGSIAKWAIHSIDRPAMLTTFLRLRKFLETAGSREGGFPSRLKGTIKVKLPFAPEWMGDQYIDPLRLLLPLDTMAMPYEQYQKKRFTAEGRAERRLNDMLHEGEITQQQYDEAMDHDGALWDRAIAIVEQEDEDLKFDAWDFASLVSSPHAPIVWGYNIARGTPEDIGPFTPMSRTLRHVATTLGIEDWNNSPLNVEAKVRKALGLPAFDRWDDYRVDRMASNMVATGEMSLDTANRIMTITDELASGKITREQAEQNPIWEQYQQAVTRANQEYAAGPAGVLLGILAMPVKSYPVGEKAQRRKQIEFSRAYEAYDQGDVAALTRFFDENPEYESRLALFKEPEERMQRFLSDQMWGLYHELPQVHRRDLRDHLGGDFDTFLSGGEVPPERMQIWLKLAGADPIGTLSANASLLSDFYGKVQYSDPEMAWRVQSFYNTRTGRYSDWHELQSGYYDLPAGKARKDYLKENPELKEYWDWRRDFMGKNPDTTPYLTDNEKDLAKFAKMQRIPGVSVPTAQEFIAQLSMPMRQLMAEEEMPEVVIRRLEQMGAPYNLSAQEVMYIIQAGLSP